MIVGQFEEMDGFLEGIDTAGSSALSYLVVLGFRYMYDLQVLIFALIYILLR